MCSCDTAKLYHTEMAAAGTLEITDLHAVTAATTVKQDKHL